LLIIKAAKTPGIHPAIVRRSTIKTDPHPLSTTAKGGKMIQSKTLQSDISFSFFVNMAVKLDKKTKAVKAKILNKGYKWYFFSRY
jgi:hypothetical protein